MSNEDHGDDLAESKYPALSVFYEVKNYEFNLEDKTNQGI